MLGRELLLALHPGQGERRFTSPSYLYQSCRCQDGNETAGQGSPRRRPLSLRITSPPDGTWPTASPEVAQDGLADVTQARWSPPLLPSCASCISSPLSRAVPDTTNGRATSDRAASFAPSLRPPCSFWGPSLPGHRSNGGMNRPTSRKGADPSSMPPHVRPKPRHRGIRLAPLLAFRPPSLHRRPPLALRDSSRLEHFATASFPACLRYPRPLQPESHRL